MAEAEKQALKILHLGKLFPPDQGGIESLTQQLVSDFNELGHKTDVLCANSARQTVVTQSHYTVVRAASWFKLKSVYFAPAIFCWLFRWRNSYDILHVHSPNPLAWLAIFLIRPKGRMIIHWHSDITKQRVLAKLLAPLTNWILNRASAIVVTSENYRNHSTQLYSYLDKVSVIPIYVCKPTAIREKPFQPSISVNLFTLGRLVSDKAIDVLIRALPLLPANYHLTIGGDGPLLGELKALAVQLKVEPRITWLGPLGENKWDQFSKCDIFVLPSRFETFGLVLLEAMIMGKPVICTDLGGSAMPWINVNGLTGLTFKNESEVDLAGKIETLGEDPVLAAKFAKNSVDRVEEIFSRDRVLCHWVDLYESIFSSGAPDASSMVQQ